MSTTTAKPARESLTVGTREASQLLGISMRVVREYAKAGILTPVRYCTNSQLRFRRRDVYALAGELDDGKGA